MSPVSAARRAQSDLFGPEPQGNLFGLREGWHDARVVAGLRKG